MFSVFLGYREGLGFCDSCGAPRVAQTAARRVDHASPMCRRASGCWRCHPAAPAGCAAGSDDPDVAGRAPLDHALPARSGRADGRAGRQRCGHVDPLPQLRRRAQDRRGDPRSAPGPRLYRAGSARARKARINAAISSPLSSSAKCPVSSRCNSAPGRSRRYG